MTVRNRPIKYILLDTNIFIRHQFSGKQLRDLSAYLKRIDGHLVMPDVVEEECLQNYKEGFENELLTAKKLTRLKDAALITAIEISPEKIDRLVQEKVFSSFHTNQIAKVTSEDISARKLLKKAIKTHSPFKQSGDHSDAGFKDALIWEHCLTWLDKHRNEQLAFITGNTRDFGKDTLSTNLAEELNNLGFSERLHYLKGIPEFFELQRSYVDYVSVKEIRSIIHSLAKIDAATVKTEELDDVELGYPIAYDDYRVKEINYDDFQVADVYISDEEEKTITLDVECVLNFNLTAEVLHPEHYIEYDWDGEQGYPTHPPSLIDDGSGWVSKVYSLLMDKDSKDVIEITVY